MGGSAAAVTLRRRHPGQQVVVDGASRFNVAMCGRRFGKTALGIDLCVEGMLRGETWGWFAPTYKILNPAWGELVGVLQGVPGFKKMEQDRIITLPTGGSVECWSLDTPDPGRSRKYHGIVVDEAGMVVTLRAIWNSALRATLADYAEYPSRAWFFGTPKDVSRDFHLLYKLGQGEGHDPEWASFNLPMAANPFISAKEIEQMRRTMPEADFRREVLGEMVDTGDHPIGLDAIAACVGSLSEAEPLVWGVDLARAVDFTVAVGLDAGGHVCRLERWKLPWWQTKDRLKRMLGNQVAYIDSTGVGDPIVEDLQRAGVRAQGMVFSARSKQQWVEGLIAAIQQQRVRYPDGWLRNELDILTAQKHAGGTRYSAPEGPDFHDDGVMALALAWQGYAPVPLENPRRAWEDEEGVSPGYDWTRQRPKARVSAEDEMERMFQRTTPRRLATRYQLPRGR